MSETKTKWIYTIYDPEGNLITDNGNYNTLKDLGIASGALCAFSTKKCDDIITKKYRVIRKSNKEIVQTDEKSLE